MTLEWPSPAAIATTAAITTSLIVIAKVALWPSRPSILPNPLLLSHAQQVYTPDSFPGGRTVDTPYGSIRIYEFGPEHGPQVLLVHGISTSCITLGRIAHVLVARGHRVMLFDLFGRGFSDGVGDLPHDSRLYTTQILMVLASSSLPWSRFHLIGYSMGGAVAIPFANTFPHRVSSLVLLAPAGLIDAAAFGLVSRFVFSSGLVPERVVAAMTARRLQNPIAARSSTTAVAAAAAEAGEDTPLEKRVLGYVRWMVLHHQGFVSAFMSCIRYAPLTGQHHQWRALARRAPGTTAVIFAKNDELIHAREYEVHGLPLAGGKDNVVWRVLPGSHDFVMTHADEIMAAIDEFWGRQDVI